MFTSAHAEEALNFTKAALRKDNANYESNLYNAPRARAADPNQASIFFWIYSAYIQSATFARVLDDREQMARYEESYFRGGSNVRIECDNDGLVTDNPPGRWAPVRNIPFSPDQDPNHPMQNSQRNQNGRAPGTVLEYTDLPNGMRENGRSNFCWSRPNLGAVLHMTPERDNEGQVEPRYVITICNMTRPIPFVYRSMDNFMASPLRYRSLYYAPINIFGQFRSLLFLYMLYQLPPLGKAPLSSWQPGPQGIVGLGDLAAIFRLDPNSSRNHAGAFAWYDLLAGFADRGYVIKEEAWQMINDVINGPPWTPEMLIGPLMGPFDEDSDYLYTPGH